jgi:FixJ family two-component response regulator
VKYLVVIDDDKLVEEYLEQFLRRAGYGEKSFSDPKEAFDFITGNREEVALVITDLTMPCMTGVQLGEELMKAAVGIPIILFTGDAVPPDADDLSSNIKIVLQKPITRKEFIHAVESLIGQAQDVG